MRNRIFLLVMVVLAFCPGCEKRFTDINEYAKYVESSESPYVQQVVKNGVKVTLRYLPTDVMLIQNYRRYQELKNKLQNDTSMMNQEQRLQEAKNEISKARETYDNSLYFVMTIGYEDRRRDIEFDRLQDGFGEYSAWLNRLAFTLGDYIHLETHAIDDVPLAVYHMDRTFGMTKNRSFLLVFPRKYDGRNVLDPKNEWMKVRIEEFGLRIGKLELQFTIPSNDKLFVSSFL